jgi:Membrane transport protein
VANILRFSMGPLMLGKADHAQPEEDVIPQYTAPDEGTALLGHNQPTTTRVRINLRTLPRRAWQGLVKIWNPPLTGALLAVIIGLVQPLKHEFYDTEGFFFGSVTTSLINIGELFTALMLFVLGAGLQIKTTSGGRPPWGVLLYIFVMRFFVIPALGLVIVWQVVKAGWLVDDAHEGKGTDPIMIFIMCLMPAGPPYEPRPRYTFCPSVLYLILHYPILSVLELLDAVDLIFRAIVLANIAELAGVSQAQIGRLLILSYVVSPTIAFTVAAALKMIKSLV